MCFSNNYSFGNINMNYTKKKLSQCLQEQRDLIGKSQNKSQFQCSKINLGNRISGWLKTLRQRNKWMYNNHLKISGW